MAEAKPNDLHQRAKTALDNSPIRVLRSVHVEQTGRTLVLSGHVESFYQKQLAQELVRTVASECELINSIHVQ